MPHLSANFAAVLYTVSAILFILALRGLSSPETSRRGNMFGMVGIAIAIVTTLLVSGMGAQGFMITAAALAVGGVVGALIAKKIPMTDMPQLVAAFHSLVGLAAVLVALAAFFSPESFGIMTEAGIKPFSLLELALGAAIGAITFSGSVIAFLKLNGNTVDDLGHCWHYFVARLLADYPNRRCGYARCCVYAEFIFGLGGGGAGLHARQSCAHYYGGACGLIRGHTVLYYV